MFFGAIVFGAAVVACGPPKTSLTQVWQAETPRTPFKSMLVFGVRMDEANRRTLEDTFVADLARHGVTATPSYAVFKGDLPPIDQARAQVDKEHYEAVLVLKLRGVRDDMRYTPTTTGFWSGYYGGWGYYGSPGAVVTDETVVFETTLWDLRTGDRLVWTARTETLNPSNGRDFAISLKRAIDPTLAREGFIVAPPPKRE
jgi:hypothetical protein